MHVCLRVMFSFAGVLVHMYFSVSAPSAQHGLHLFQFSHALLIFKTSCWLIQTCDLSLPDAVAPTICVCLQLLLGGRCHPFSLEISLKSESWQTCSELCSVLCSSSYNSFVAPKLT